MRALVLVGFLLTACAPAEPVQDMVEGGGGDGAGGCGESSGDDTGGGDDSGGGGAAQLGEALDADELLAHLDALDEIGRLHDDTRAAGSEGYSASTDYVIEALEGWGYEVEIQEFGVWDYEELAPALLEIDGVAAGEEGEDFQTFTYSGSGSAEGTLVAVDLHLPPGSEANTSTSGCEASDYADFPEGAVALVQRGTCTFVEKAEKAEAAGAVGMILFNEGQPGRDDLIWGTLDAWDAPSIPVIDATFELGEALAAGSGDITARLETSTLLSEKPTYNVLAETPGGDEGSVLMVGSHLDSVDAGPGINDNGTGTATVLEIARLVATEGWEPGHKVRFAWWGAEEAGLLGSEAYIEGLSSEEHGRILAYLNYDMVGSPNGAPFIYDGDGSATGGAGPTGSDVIEEVYEDWFEAEGMESLATAFDGRSDYGPFIWTGIPAGGLFTGAEGEKSTTEADLFGGTAGASYDSCYHRDCDTRDNIDEVLFVDMAKAAAHAADVLASTDLLAPFAEGQRSAPAGLVDRWDYRGCGHRLIR